LIIKTDKIIPASEITDPQIFRQRRAIVKALVAGVAGAGFGLHPALAVSASRWQDLSGNRNAKLDSLITPKQLATEYTNYYEFSFNKEEAGELAKKLPIDPWSVEISGEVEAPVTLHLEDLLRQQVLQEYIYRFRCVEAWSMVVPWVGFSLAGLLKQVKPLSSARFVKFTSVYAPEVMPAQQNKTMLDWPYVEGLRLDEAMHPLTILAVGMYGDSLPKQNGAPLRLVVPWKYGFKSIKAITRIELLKRAPFTSWNKYAPREYGFYANVNPAVPHPRWSQYSERLLGSNFFTSRRKTELFNGYGEQVADLYRNMDLEHFF
jgi:methionine sulfoxide reductase catalytic subunit